MANSKSMRVFDTSKNEFYLIGVLGPFSKQVLINPDVQNILFIHQDFYDLEAMLVLNRIEITRGITWHDYGKLIIIGGLLP